MRQGFPDTAVGRVAAGQGPPRGGCVTRLDGGAAAFEEVLHRHTPIVTWPAAAVARHFTAATIADVCARPWQWDETLYGGSAAHYVKGRMPYPPAITDAVREKLRLDGTGRLLDVGCGPGSLTLLLAPLFEAAVGIDADRFMIEAARERATEAGVDSVSWRALRAEDLPAGLGTFRAVSFAQSFHWMDQPVVAARVRDMLTPGGAWIHVLATTHRGVDGTDELAHPRPPWDAVDELVAHYVGAVRRAGQGTLPTGTRAGEEDVMRGAGYAGPTRIEVGGGQVVERDVDEISSAVFSLSGSAPHLFGDRLAAFESDLRAVLRHASPTGRFSERTREVALVIWRR
jgi:SAM-dependent methyltransferase